MKEKSSKTKDLGKSDKRGFEIIGPVKCRATLNTKAEHKGV
jgi:hypothetical protein